MLRSVFPRAHQKYFSLPLLGPITDGFDDWLAASGFTLGSRTLAINLLPIADKQLRRRGIDEVAKLNHAVLDDCCKALKKRYPFRAGTIHTLERYLVANGLIVDGRHSSNSAIEFERRVCGSPPRSSRIRDLHRFQPPAHRAVFPTAPGSSGHCVEAHPALPCRIVRRPGRQTAEPGQSTTRHRRPAWLSPLSRNRW